MSYMPWNKNSNWTHCSINLHATAEALTANRKAIIVDRTQNPMSTTDPIPSPCIRQCCLDDDDMCLGCFRLLSEITGWGAADDATRRHILDNTRDRQKAHSNPSINAYPTKKA